MRTIEKDNESLKGVLPKDYARPALNKVMLGELIDLISGIALNEAGDRSKDILGRVYEYFLGQFAGAVHGGQTLQRHRHLDGLRKLAVDVSEDVFAFARGVGESVNKIHGFLLSVG